MIRVIMKEVVDPLRELQSISNSISLGHLDVNIPSKNFNEFGKLGTAFSKMRDAIVFQLAETKRISALAATNMAISRMTQCLAHDVRKPFSMLKTGLNFLQDSSNEPEKFKRNLGFLVSEIDRATKSVDGMLTDIMEVDSTSTELIPEPAAPEILIEMILGEAFRIYPKSKISIFYDFKHSAMVNVHHQKVNRVFSNIVCNAIQAMNYVGTMWFRTKMDGNFVQFCIGNSGSSIPPEHLGKLFEAFFTSGKKSGSGLGLAIAQKVVHAHGGKIWCESSNTREHPEGRVEFFFTLPIAPGAELVTTANLPHHSDEITMIVATMGLASISKSDGEFNESDSLLQRDVLKRARVLSRPLGILIVDDESIYRSTLAGWIEKSPELAQVCRIHLASGNHDAINAFQSSKLDLIITDIDMGANSLSGFDLVKELRTTHVYKGLIFVHSNRIVPDDHRKASDFGANGFIPKPMAKGQLFKLILQSIQSISLLAINISSGHIKYPETLAASESNSHPLHKWNLHRPLIAVIDDEYFFRHQWPPFLKGFDTVCYSNAEEFISDWDQICKKLVAVVTDQYLGSGISGIQLSTLLRKKSPNLTLILSTSDPSVKKDGHIFDAVVDKDAQEEAPKIIQHIIKKNRETQLWNL